MPNYDNMTFKQLRSIATGLADWPQFMKDNGVNSATVTMAQLKDFLAWQDEKNGGQGFDTSKDESFVPQAKAPANASNPANELASLITKLAGNAMNEDAIMSIVHREIKAAIAQVPAFRIEMQSNGIDLGALEGSHHPSFTELATIASARLPNGYHPNIWLAGPAGSGKTHAAGALAKLMGKTFGSHGAMTMAHELIGFVDANGHYHETQFVKAFREGGLVLLDELDAGENSALLALQGALANSHMSLPNGTMLERNKDFVCIGAANTWGLGATADYIGRNKLDAAFLNRFVPLAWDYDVALEQAICGNAKWAERVQAARARARAAGLKVVISPRASIHGAALLAAGIKPDRAAELTYLASLSTEQIKIVEGR